MNGQSTNPYASPNATVDASTTRAKNSLIVLWVWLAVAVLAAIFATPADPISMLVALAYGLVLFCGGATLGSSQNVGTWTLVIGVCVAAIIAFTFVSGGTFFVVPGTCYGVLSVGMGVWASRSITSGRVRILLSFSVGYIVGSLATPLGTVAGAVLCAVVANRLSEAHNLDEGG